MTVTMLSRITLHLRRTGKRTSVICFDDHHHRPSSVVVANRSDNSERRLLDPTFASNPLDSVFSTTRSFDTQASPVRTYKGKEPEAKLRRGCDSEQHNSIVSVDSAMYGRPVSYARVPEINIRQRESSNSAPVASSSTHNEKTDSSSQVQR